MRTPQPHWKKSHRCWYVKIEGKFHRLDPDREKAWQIYHELMSAPAGDLSDPNVKVRDLLAEFLQWTEGHRSERTLQWYQEFLSGRKGFAASVPSSLRVRDVKPYHVTRWLSRRYPNAGPNTVAGAITAVKRAFNWAVDEGYIQRSPVSTVKKPPRQTRGDEAYLLPKEWRTFFKSARNESFQDYLIVLKETGCRPQEIRQVEAKHFDRDSRCWVFPKDARGKLRNRVVHLSDRAFEICSRLTLKNPDGPLFRNTQGRPWTAYALNCAFARTSARSGIKACPYIIRHTFATEAIIRGVDLVTIATLMGHSDLTMLQKIYQHVSKKQDHLKASLNRAIGGDTSVA